MSVRLPMMANILAQASSLEGVLRHGRGDGADAAAACARLLRSTGRRLLISGMGASYFAAMPVAAALARQGRPVHMAESSELLHFGEGAWSAGDVALLISRSGASVEVLRLAEKMRAAGVRLVGVTNILESPLAELSDEVLLVRSGADQIIAIQTYTGTLFALLLLAEQVGETDASARLDRSAAIDVFGEFVQETVQGSEDWGEFLAGDAPLYVLGRGEALAAVHEGTLLFHETAKLSAIGMSSGQFRHGPVEAISPQSRAIVIGSQAPTRALDWRLALDLQAMGAGVRWIGPQVAQRQGRLNSLGRWPEQMPEGLESLFDIVPLQVAAYRAALARGNTPGSFRYASEITADEAGFPFFEASLT